MIDCMPVYSYHTIEAPAEGMYKEKGSKFLSFAYPVSSEAEIKEKIDWLKKEYFDARHHCYAWMLGQERVHFRSFDDGEPNHTAGDPILGKIKSAGLTNILIVVVRYFGGIKLGVGGLISAYKAAAEDALIKTLVVEKYVEEVLNLSFDYETTPDIMRVLKDLSVKIIDQNFSDRTNMTLKVTLHQKLKLQSRLELIRSGGKFIDWEFES
jgi:uncharacterized YigZ family protein